MIFKKDEADETQLEERGHRVTGSWVGGALAQERGEADGGER